MAVLKWCPLPDSIIMAPLTDVLGERFVAHLAFSNVMPCVLVQTLCVCFQVYILPFGGPVSIQWHAGLAEGVWLGAGSQLRQHPNGLGQGHRHIHRTEPTGMSNKSRHLHCNLFDCFTVFYYVLD